MKAIGAEILEFVRAEWPDGVYYDEYDGDPETLDPKEKYDLGRFGALLWDGNPETGESGVDFFGKRLVFPSNVDRSYNFSAGFLAWRRSRTVATFVLTVPKADVDEAKALAKSRGWTLT